MKLGQTIERLMKDQGLSQKDLSKQVGISQTSMSLIISGATFPKPETLKAIATALGSNVPMLFYKCVDINNIPVEKRPAAHAVWPFVDDMFRVLFDNPSSENRRARSIS